MESGTARRGDAGSWEPMEHRPDDGTPGRVVDVVRVRVPSKVNLFLAIRGTRDDGYHELVSIMQTVGIRDELELALAGTPWACLHPAARRYMKIELEHDAGDAVPTDDRNLSVRAARALLEAIGATHPHDGSAPDEVPSTRIALTKRIPVAAGMAGGSADAAATLVGLNRLWDCDLDRDQLRDIAAGIGADVPFCVTGGTALATGTGTATAQVLSKGPFHWAVAMSDRPLSTPDVYRTWDDVGTATQMEPDAVLQALRTGDAEMLGAALHNDLESAAFALRPELRDLRDTFLDAGALGAIVSGSGPTVVALGADQEDAERLTALAAEHADRVESAVSPAAGPEVSVR